MNTGKLMLLALLYCVTLMAEVQEKFQWENMNKGTFGIFSEGWSMDYDTNGVLYIGAGKYLATWDGNILNTIDSVNGSVFHVQFSPTGELFVAGEFDSIGVKDGRIEANNIARWSGTRWEPLAQGTDKKISEFDFSADGSLYACGEFRKAGEIFVSYLARWQGGKWHETNSVARSKTTAIHCASDGSLYLGGGGFYVKDENDSLILVNIAQWDGEQWLSVGGKTLNNYVLDITEDSKGTIYAGGNFIGSCAKWDGGQWEFLLEGRKGVNNLFVDSNDTLFLEYEEEDSTCVKKYVDGALHTVATLFSSGYFNGVNAIIKDEAGALFFTGVFTSVATPENPTAVSSRNISSVQNGTVKPCWNRIDSAVNKVAKGPDGTIYIGGNFTHAGTQNSNHIAKWDGEIWQPLGKGVDGPVFDIAFSLDGVLTAAGQFSSAGEVSATSVAQWNGQQWKALGGGVWHGDTPGLVRSVAYDQAGNLYVAGLFTHAGEIGNLVEARNIAKWDGTSWTSLAGGLDSTVYSITIGSDGLLYAGGQFITAGSVSANHVACWDGTAWSPMGEGVDSLVRVVEIDREGTIYIGGDLAYTIGTQPHQILKWNGTTWEAPIETALDSTVETVFDITFDKENRLWAAVGGARCIHSIAVLNEEVWTLHDHRRYSLLSLLLDDEYIYIGGSFVQKEFNASIYITRAVIPKIIPVLPDFTLQTKGKHFDPDKAILLYNIRGQKIGLFENGLQLEHSLRNKSLSSGVYFQRQGTLVQKMQVR